MHIKILGSAAGGGFPQWNCACRNCSGFRTGHLQAALRTQTQVAFSPDGSIWFLLAASPDLRSQILATPQLAPSEGEATGTPIGGIFLPSADVDALMGLLHLREFQSFFLFATPAIQKIVQTENRIFDVLHRADPPVQWQSLTPGSRLACRFGEDPSAPPTFICSPISVGGGFPDYVSTELRRSLCLQESVIALRFEQSGNSFFFAPALPEISGEWLKAAASSTVALLDGTFWSDDELLSTGRGQKTAREMGHLPLSGRDGLLSQFPSESATRKILIHINNTNPVLDESSAEHRAVREAGFEIAYDGMELTL
ncbi:MAG TPA: pyrroloquinoline quinone biosynthesis protein PqqB [Candidatus Eisenbacteria bacterium]|jgi:pyrroloquinoline quinone biosynthesis protein B|nr:pyrroloquinoline quinone biosynthesis protein PqqB [Candidatus Eisenbacteria bacterium]